MVLVTVMLWLGWGWQPSQLDCGATEADPRVISVVVPDRQAERLVRQELPRVRIVVLRTEPNEPLDVVLERAWDCRDADCFFYNPERECLSLASVRERLRQQGVVAIDLTEQVAGKTWLPLAWQAAEVAGR